MSTTVAPHPWPAPAYPAIPSSWRIACELHRPGQPVALQWLMARHTSFVPGQLLGVYLALSALGLGIGAAFWWLGVPAVLPFAGLELLLLGAAFWVCARHAGDGETILLAERELQVEHRFGRLVDRTAFRAEWVRVEPVHGEGSLLELSGQGRRMRVGRYLRPHLRMALARELRLALRRECAPGATQDMQLGQSR